MALHHLDQHHIVNNHHDGDGGDDDVFSSSFKLDFLLYQYQSELLSFHTFQLYLDQFRVLPN